MRATTPASPKDGGRQARGTPASGGAEARAQAVCLSELQCSHLENGLTAGTRGCPSTRMSGAEHSACSRHASWHTGSSATWPQSAPFRGHGSSTYCPSQPLQGAPCRWLEPTSPVQPTGNVHRTRAQVSRHPSPRATGLAAPLCGPGLAPHPHWAPASSSTRNLSPGPSPANRHGQAA